MNEEETLRHFRGAEIPHDGEEPCGAVWVSLVPLVGGLFMIILKDPEAARSMGLISVKAQLLVGISEWASFFDMLAQAVAIGGMVLFGIITAWVFGREFSDRTAKNLLALPTSRGTIIGAKLIVISVWSMGLTLFVFGFGLIIGNLVDIPGWSLGLLKSSFIDIIGVGLLTITLMPFVALIASAGRGYLPAFGWTFLTIIFAQVVAFTGWGDYFPWAIPAIFSGAAGSREGLLGAHSYIVIAISACIAVIALFIWWRNADQTH